MALFNSFIFDAEKETPQSIAMKRAIAAQIMGQSRNRSARNVGEGLGNAFASIGDGIVANVMNRRAEAGDKAGRESADSLYKSITSGITGGLPMPGAASEMAATSPAPVDMDMTGNDVYSGFMDTVKQGGVSNPYALAAIAATGKAESGFSPGNVNRTWSDPSESGQPGTAGGIMSWRGPRYQALAATGDLSPQGQAKFFLQENPQLIAALNNAQSVEEAQSLMNNAWKFAGYNRPGGEAGRRMSLANSFLPTFQGQGEVAALTPEAAIESIAPSSGAIAPPAQEAPPSFDMGRFGDQMNLAEMPPNAAQLPGTLIELGANMPTAMRGDRLPQAAPPLPNPINVGALPAMPVQEQPFAPQQPQMQQPPVQVAQAGQTSMPQQPQQMMGGNIPIQTLMEAAANPFLNEGQRSVVNMMLQQRMQEMDPYRQAQIEKMQREASTGGETFFGNPIAVQNEDGSMSYGQMGNKGTFRPINLPEGQSFAPPTKRVDAGTEDVLVDQSGNIIARIPKNIAGAEAEKVAGKDLGEARALYESMTSKMPGLRQTVDRLDELTEQATYTWAGRTWDEVRRQFGAEPRLEAVARAEYTAIVDNQILPLLRDTFGAQFTAAEGDRLRDTLGDPNKSPAEKKALLQAFIQQKERDIEGLASRLGGSAAPGKTGRSTTIGGYTIEEVD